MAGIADPWHDPRRACFPCRGSDVRKVLALSFVIFAALGLDAQSTTAPPSPAEKELQAPLALEDGKPTALPQESGASGMRAFGSLVLVLGLAGGALWALKRWGIAKLPGSGGTRLKVEESLALGDRRFVSILRADEERFLIALAPTGITLLARMDGLEAGGTQRFEEALAQAGEITIPMPVREVEARLRESQP